MRMRREKWISFHWKNMDIWPYERESYVSSRTPLELETLFRGKLEKGLQRKVYGVYENPLVGVCENGKLDAHRNIQYRNSFLPIAHAQFSISQRGAIIKVEYYPRLGSLASVCVFAFTCFVVGIFVLTKIGFIESLMPFAVMLTSYTVVQICFWSELPKLRNIVRSIVHELDDNNVEVIEVEKIETSAER